jgi:hypothetical protein
MTQADRVVPQRIVDALEAGNFQIILVRVLQNDSMSPKDVDEIAEEIGCTPERCCVPKICRCRGGTKTRLPRVLNASIHTAGRGFLQREEKALLVYFPTLYSD